MEPPDEYLRKRFDRPFAWMLVFGTALSAAGVVAFVGEYGVWYAPLGAVLGFVAGAGGGATLGVPIWVVCRIAGGLNRPVRRPDLWAQNLRCLACGWHTTPDGPWRRRDCLYPPETCPDCAVEVVPIIPDCPVCQARMLKGESLLRDMLAQVRIPRTFNQALWGHWACRECGCVYDRWGREVSS